MHDIKALLAMANRQPQPSPAQPSPAQPMLKLLISPASLPATVRGIWLYLYLFI